jgi:hypothetical protein
MIGILVKLTIPIDSIVKHETNGFMFNDSGATINDTFEKPEPKKGKQKEDF